MSTVTLRSDAKPMMIDAEQTILDQVRGVLARLFEIDPARIEPSSKLYEDLDIDSLDAIDLMIELKELTGRKVRPEQFKHVRTVGDVVTAVRKLVQDEDAA
ncbi:MAG TPA: acyl carrier protein [Steroidobacteraceae bacterium]|nr:acyl carrier protein [Steroidobacteraceae bacterium]